MELLLPGPTPENLSQNVTSAVCLEHHHHRHHRHQHRQQHIDFDIRHNPPLTGNQKKNHQTLIVIVQYPSPLEQESIFYFHSIVNLVDTTPDWPVQCQSSRINQNSATGVQLLIDSFRYFVEYSTNQLFGVMAWPIGKKAHLGQRLVAASTGSKLIVIDAWPFRVMPLSLL